MAKVWVLDTETKGTGAQMVPLEKVLRKPAPKPARPPVHERGPRPGPEPEPTPPPRFRVVEVLSRRVLSDDAPTRATVGVLEDVRSVVDVSIYRWAEAAGEWRLLTPREKKMLWGFRGRLSSD
jgi:hypothetical protein